MWNWVEKLTELQSRKTPHVITTIVECTGSSPRDPGAKMIVCENGEFYGTVGGGHLEKIAIEESLKVLSEGVTKKIRYPLGSAMGQCCGGVVELFFEPSLTGPEVYIFGAGHVAQALVRVLEGTPFRVHVIDERREWCEKLPKSVEFHESKWDEFVSSVKWSAEKSYVVVVTHEHSQDQEIIADLVKRETKYIGLIGSDSKWKRFIQRYEMRGFDLRLFNKVKCPIGIDLGDAKAPQEVAISISAELLKTHYEQK